MAYSPAWRLCVDTVGAGATGVGVKRLGPPGLMVFWVEDTGGGVVVAAVVLVVVVVVVVVVEGFCSPLPPHAAVSPPIAIRAPVPATAARQRTLCDLIMCPICPPTSSYLFTLPDPSWRPARNSRNPGASSASVGGVVGRSEIEIANTISVKPPPNPLA